MIHNYIINLPRSFVKSKLQVSAMKMITSLCEMPELNKCNVYVKDKEDLLNKINQIIAAGHEKLQIVTDFDHTLTRHNMDNGKVVLTSFGKNKNILFFNMHIL